jgi:DNA replication and repair protein RecF
MFIRQVNLSNFRNYGECRLPLQRGRNIFVGENAQGKTNFLEAIEFLATTRSPRAQRDTDLIRWNERLMSAEVEFESGGNPCALLVRLMKPTAAPSAGRSPRLEKYAAINGVKQHGMSDLLGRLLVVSFASHDLNLLRGGPRHRRDWIDTLILKVRPAFAETFASYSKSVAQRNRLLKQIFERGKVTVADQEQLLAWDKQVARFGARIIKQRLSLLGQLLPLAEDYQNRISRQQEQLSIAYFFKTGDRQDEQDDADNEVNRPDETLSTGPLSADQLSAMEELELAKTLLRLLKERRAEEIRRKQTTVGPHRDDLLFCLNGVDAVSFASQGQQRSIVLSLKMAEVALIRQSLNDAPVLLLDDVLAELDECRQGLLMALVENGCQTVITTTHVSGFDPRWLDGATIFRVEDGHVLLPVGEDAPTAHA